MVMPGSEVTYGHLSYNSVLSEILSTKWYTYSGNTKTRQRCATFNLLAQF